MKRLLSIVLLFFANLSYGQNCHCDSLFLQTQKIVEDNYAGWFDKVKPENRKMYDEWTAKHFFTTQKISSDSSCAKIIQQWISFFKDKHLRIKFSQPASTVAADKNSNDEIQILKSNLSEIDIDKYLKSNKRLDSIEGIYISSSYKLGITKVKPDLFYATIITTTNENWKPGEVKLVIQKSGKVYSGTFYEGDKSGISSHKVFLANNILDFDIVFYEKIFPIPTVKRDMTEYEMTKDKYAPGLSFKDNVAIWKFPSFENNSFEQTEYLLKKYKDKLAQTPYWILDLRNNSGGDYRVGMQLMEYIYTKPIIKYNSEMRMTAKNIETWFNSFVKSSYERFDSSTKKMYDAALDTMKSKIGSMYSLSDNRVDTIQLKKITVYPKKIVVLINSNTVSSGELFTILVKQSDKVTVMGSNSGGMIDYGNVVNYKTACSSIRVQLPLDRFLWLDKGVSIDKEGIKPTIYLRGNNWTAEAINKLKK